MNKIALITGASSGIGREMAKIHAESGGDLIIIARSEDKLNTLKAELEQKFEVSVTVIVKDLAKESAPREIYERVKESGIEIDYLINNAGFGGLGKFHERDWEKDRAMIQVNMVALTALTRLFLPDFVERNSGRILNVSSTAGEVPGPLQAVYYASKAYVTSFSNALAGELHDTNVSVTTLKPGATATGFADTSGMDKTEMFEKNKVATATEVAKAGYEAMLKGDINVIAGTSFTQKLTLRLTSLLPIKFVLKTIREMQET